jgi:phage RecT family recombinase
MTEELLPSIRTSLERMSPELEKLLPESVPIDRFKRVALTAISQDPQLMTAEPRDLFNELSKCAQDGLYPDKRDAAIVFYKGRPKYIPMVGGILRRLRNSRELKDLTVQIIRRNDEFQYWVDENGPHVLFKPKIFEERGDKIGAFCVATMVNGGTFVEIMTKAELQKIKNLSKAKNGPWNEWEDEMEKKTVIRRISKYLPLSADLQETIARDEEEFQDKDNENTIEIKSVKDLEKETTQCETKENAAPMSSPSIETQASKPEPLPIKNEEKPKQKKSEDKEKSEFSDAQLRAEILRLSKELGWDNKQLIEWGQSTFKKTMRDLSNGELAECANILAQFLYGSESEQ